MRQLKVPSIQHLARMSGDDPEVVRKGLIYLFDNPPRSSYRVVERLMPDLLLFNQPLAELEKAVRRGERRPNFQEDFIEILRLARDHFEGIRADYVDAVTTRFYSAGRDLMIPFRPPVFFGQNGATALPWFSYWKRNPLNGTKLSLFVTVVRDILSEDPDLEDTRLDLLDFSAPSGSNERDLAVANMVDVPLLTAVETRERLEIFAEGFFRAQAEIASRVAEPSDRPSAPGMDGQIDLFD